MTLILVFKVTKKSFQTKKEVIFQGHIFPGPFSTKYCITVFVAAARASMPSYIYLPRSRGDNAFGSISVFVAVCVCVCLYVCPSSPTLTV